MRNIHITSFYITQLSHNARTPCHLSKAQFTGVHANLSSKENKEEGPQPLPSSSFLKEVWTHFLSGQETKESSGVWSLNGLFFSASQNNSKYLDRGEDFQHP